MNAAFSVERTTYISSARVSRTAAADAVGLRSVGVCECVCTCVTSTSPHTRLRVFHLTKPYNARVECGILDVVRQRDFQ